MPRHAALSLELLGGFRATGEPARGATRLPTVRQQQIVAFLALHAREGPVPRQRVSGALWPDSSDVQALTNLRRELHHLREDWPKLDALIDAGSRTLAWRGSAGAIVDVVAFETAAEKGLAGDRASLREAASLYRGDLMPGVSGEWIDSDRERLRQRARDVLTALVAALEQDHAFSEAIEHAQHLLRLDPLDEQAWCALMRCHARRGDRATALHLYQECAALLKRELGVQPGAATRQTYREILDLDSATPTHPASPRTATYPLVGRHAEWRTLLGAWQAAAAGHTRLCIVRGEAGIGKTRLTEELSEWLHANGIASIGARCYAGEGRLAYAPIASWLRNDALQPALKRLPAATIADLARLRPELSRGPTEAPAFDQQLERWQRLRFFDSLTQAFRTAAPLVLIIDDLQWADGDTVEWLQYFVRAAVDTRCLVVGTIRAEEEQDNPSLGRLLMNLERDASLTAITLGPLDRTATAQLAGEVMEHTVDDLALARLFRETEGHPLFIIERGRMDASDTTASRADAPLAQVQAVVAARLALLTDEGRATAELAAAVGRDFEFSVLAAASDLEEDALVRALDELWRRHIVRVQSDDRWDFSHDRIREVAYSGIGPARRRLIHRRIAQAMELLFADQLDDVSASIAVHLERSGQVSRAIPFLERAAAVATRVSATEEAIRCLTHGVALLERMPPGQERDQRELRLRSSLSVALNSGRGYAAVDVERNLDRIFTLSKSTGDSRVPVRWLWAAFTMRYMLGELSATRVVAEEALARSVDDPSCRCEAHHAMGGMLLSVGELDASKRHFEASLAAYNERRPQRSALGSDLGVFAHAWYTQTLWLLDESDAAVGHIDEAIALAGRLNHAYSRALALAYAALLHQLRSEPDRSLACAREAVALCERYGFGYYGDWAQVFIGWATGLDEPARGTEIIETALDRLDRQRAHARRPYYLSLLADTWIRRGDVKRASAIVADAIALSVQRGEAWWLPALYEMHSDVGPADERVPAHARALELASAQNSRALIERIRSSTLFAAR